MLQIIGYEQIKENNTTMNTQESFVHFLDGYLTDKTELNQEQTKILKDRLGAVFNKVTPNLYNNPDNKLYFDPPTTGGLNYNYGPVHTC